MRDKIVRAARFFEEAAELAQAVGLPRDHAMRAFDHVYSRPAGEPAQEVGGSANTLMALCGAIGLSFDGCQQAEIARCLAKDPSHFAERNEAKLRDVDALKSPSVALTHPSDESIMASTDAAAGRLGIDASIAQIGEAMKAPRAVPTEGTCEDRGAAAELQEATIEKCIEIASTIGPAESPIGIPSISTHDLRQLIVNGLRALESSPFSGAREALEASTIITECQSVIEVHADAMRVQKTTLTPDGLSAVARTLLPMVTARLEARGIAALKSPSVAVQPVGDDDLPTADDVRGIIPLTPVGDWRPIETAPRDGTTIIIGRWSDIFGFVMGYAYWEGGTTKISGWLSQGFCQTAGNLGLAGPTHWQPLPAPPSAASSTNQSSEGGE